MLRIWFSIVLQARSLALFDRTLVEIGISGKRVGYASVNTAVMADFTKASESLHAPFRCSVIRRAIRGVEAAKFLYRKTRHVVGNRQIMKDK
jgi:hypothetical protein